MSRKPHHKRRRDTDPTAPDGNVIVRMPAGAWAGLEHAVAHWYACPAAARLGAQDATPEYVSRAASQVDQAAALIAAISPASRGRLPGHAVERGIADTRRRRKA